MYGLIKEIVVILKEIWMWARRRKRTIKDSIEIGNKVDKVLDKLLEETNADRVFVFQFHNGSYFYTGNSIDKMTNTHERCSPGISYEQLKYREVGTAPFRFFLEKVVKENVYSCPDISSISHYNTKLMMLDRGTKSFIIRVMNDAFKRPVGFIGIDFVKSNKDITKVDEKKVIEAAESIYDILVYGKTK